VIETSTDYIIEKRLLRERSKQNSKFETRNPKQIQMFKKQKVLNGPFWILDFGFAGFRLFRISIFGFRILLGGLEF
jgi:hypothetical protein